uniref:Proliferating cell nuclear antigen PCNA C-terminal domain-containing protein n=1 Tax=Panagrolaimus sp. ES5 TaxID=591445 RepID=A0AC34GIV1_9BILA
MKAVSNALKCANSGDTGIIKYADTDQNNINFSFHDSGKTKIQELTLARMVVDAEHLQIPDQTYAAMIEMSSVEFSKVFHDLAQFTETVTITVTKDGVTFSGKNDHSGSIMVTYNGKFNDDTGECLLFYHQTDAEKKSVTSRFSTRQMHMFAKASGLSDRVRLYLSPNEPIKIEYNINDDTGYLRYYLAPRIDDDDMMF